MVLEQWQLYRVVLCIVSVPLQVQCNSDFTPPSWVNKYINSLQAKCWITSVLINFACDSVWQRITCRKCWSACPVCGWDCLIMCMFGGVL